MNNINEQNRKVVILCLVQIVSILGFHLAVKLISSSTKQPILISTPNQFYLYIISPPLIAAISSLFLCLIFPLKMGIKNGVWVSIPATIIYFLIFIILPLNTDGFNSAVEALPYLFVVMIPLTIALLLVNGYAIWLGSLMRSKLLKLSDRTIE